ncbi:MAG TPA: alanine racemase [Actinomycetota bacterium]
MTDFRATRVEVDLGAIRDNVGVLKPDGVELMAVVKADGYGHGAPEVARAALEAGAAWIGVALVEEGLVLRSAGVEAPVLVLSELPAGSERAAIDAGLTPPLYTDAALGRLVDAAGGRPLGVHVKVDTGMHRGGVWPPEDATGFVQRVLAAGLRLDGFWTHLAVSAEDPVETALQLDRFDAAVGRLRAAGLDPGLLHAANTGAVILHPRSHLSLVRPGIGIYGLPPAPGIGEGLGLRPALAWRSAVVNVKPLTSGERISYGLHYELDRDASVATVPVGYADGYPRSLSSRADVLVRGRRRRIAGNVTMDQLMVDCGDGPVEPGDEVVLIGTQGDETIEAEELAGLAGTIGYEVVARIGRRVPRVYAG